MEARERILEAAIAMFSRKGVKFTMDDIAGSINMSKKTIYTVFRDKETLLCQLVDYCFDKIKESEREIMEKDDLSTVEKLREILGVLPESYQNIDFGQIYPIREKYPGIYRRLEERLESGWESTIALLEQGMEEGVLRRTSIVVFKTMYEATLQQFLRRDILTRNRITYRKALDEVVDILVDGIRVKA